MKFILSLFDYCDIAWRSLLQQDQERLQSVEHTYVFIVCMYVCTLARIITCCIRLSEAMNHLARTQRERDCPQAKIDSEIYLCLERAW